MYRAYETELYRFDQLYRHFCEAADTRRGAGLGHRSSRCGQEIEAHYVNWYLTTLALAWGKFVEPQDGLLTKWQIEKVPNQHEFYDQPGAAPPGRRPRTGEVFVIISDAFRYEAAQELTRELNGKYRFEADADLATRRAAVLHRAGHGQPAAAQDARLQADGDVLVDGKPSARRSSGTTSCRPSTAWPCKADDLMAMKKDEGREFVSGQAGGLHLSQRGRCRSATTAKTEGQTFEAVRKAIDELAALVGYIVNNLNGNHIVITADHGFLFTETAPGETDKSKLSDKPDGTVMAKKRYLLGHNLPDHEAAWHGKTSVDGRGRRRHGVLDSRREPTGSTSSGGARFIHGGAMLAGDRGAGRHRQARQGQVGCRKPRPSRSTVQVLGTNHQITTRRLPLRVDPDGAGQRPGEADHAEGRHLRGRGAGHQHRDRDVRQRLRQHGRAEEVGQPGPEGSAIRQEDTLPPGAAGRRNRHRAAERAGDHRQGLHR